MEMVQIYSVEQSPRLTYTLDFIFKEVLMVDYSLTLDLGHFKNLEGCKINYSTFLVENALQIFPTELLFQQKIVALQPDVLFWKNHLAIFKTGGIENEIPFDFFAAVFFLLSRYEEYLPHEIDNHGRFKATNSLAFKNGVLQKPLIDIWCYELRNILIQKFKIEIKNNRKFSYLATFDIDNAYAYKYKTIGRTFAASAREILTFRVQEFLSRWKTILNFSADSYDTYQYIVNKKKEVGFDSIIFFLLGDYHKYDKNLHYKNKKFKALIVDISKQTEVGIHPSYFSNRNKDFMNIEKNRLQNIINKKINASRQHYLMLKLPETYKNLCQLGIADDYTMGYSEQVGFRASTCTAFYFYDLEKEQITNLKIHPFAYMEVTLHNYLKLLPAEAIKIIEALVEEVKKVDGCFISLWHNESLSENKHWKGWRNVFEANLKAVSKK